MKKILLPVDFSTYSKVAVEYALEMFGKSVYPDDVTFILLHVYSPGSAPVYPGSPYVHASPVHLRDIIRNARKQLEKAGMECRERFPGQLIREELMEGSPVEAIHEVARSEEADLIVMGTKGLGAVDRAVVGSVALGVFREAPCPVLVIPEEAKFRRPERVVFATDFRNLDDLHILDPLSDLVDAFEPSFMLLHIYTEMETSAGEKTRMNHLLRDYFHARNYSHYFLKRHDPVAGVEEFVKGSDADLLALVRHEHTFFEKLFHKSLTKNMIIHSEVPVFVLNLVKAKKGHRPAPEKEKAGY